MQDKEVLARTMKLTTAEKTKPSVVKKTAAKRTSSVGKRQIPAIKSTTTPRKKRTSTVSSKSTKSSSLSKSSDFSSVCMLIVRGCSLSDISDVHPRAQLPGSDFTTSTMPEQMYADWMYASALAAEEAKGNGNVSEQLSPCIYYH